ncbi:glycerate kinase [Tessaracoccus terricola]
MRVVVAVDSFKGTIGAAAAAAELAAGWGSVAPDAELVLRPMADGGEGTLDAFAAAVPGAERFAVAVTGPDGEPVEASWLLLPGTDDAPRGTAVVELASTSGIELLGERRPGLDADTTGFGQAIAAALDHGVSRLLLGIGSSASTDGGVGMLRALGGEFTDNFGDPIAPGARGLARLASAHVDRVRRPPVGGVKVLTDVTNPLLGPLGAAAVFGPQKGLDAAGIATAEAGLARLAKLMPVPVYEPGSGAAGGTGFALLAWGAELVPGAPEVARLVGLREAIAGADLVITGEGSFDGQSAAGKVPGFVAELAEEAGVPTALVAGRITDDADTTGFRVQLSLSELAGSGSAALTDPARWLREAGVRLASQAW